MEEKFTQIKLNVGTVEEPSVEPVTQAETEDVQVEDTEEKSISIKLDEPDTIPIDIAENRQQIPIGDDVKLVSPDESVFTRVAENVNNDKSSEKLDESRLSTEWHDSEVDSGENFILDDTFASNAHADRQFMETFGIKSSGAVKAVVEKDLNNDEREDTRDNNETGSYEYTERLQNKEIKNMYDYAVSGIGKKLIFSVIFALMLFFVENLTLFIENPQGILNIESYTYLHVGVSLGLLILCAICAHEQMYHGFRSIVTKDYLPESIAVISFIIGVIHSIVSLVLVTFGYKTPHLFNFVSAAIIIGTILYSFVNVVREEYGFRAIAGKDPKFILESVQESNAEAEYDTFTTTSNGEYNGQIARIGKTGFVKNYFHNTNVNADIRTFIGFYYIIALVVPIAFSIISIVRGGGIDTLTTFWGIGSLLLLPIGTLCAYSVPFYVGNKRLFDDGVAIIGEDAIKEFAKTNVVAVNDTTAFPPQNIKIKNFHVYNDFTIEKILYYATNGFSLVGGPLAEVFEAAANESVTASKRVRFVCTGRSILGFKIDNDKVVFADKFGMVSQGIEIGNEREGKDNLSVMYIAINDVLAAKMYIEYEIDEEFLRIVRMLNKNGVGVGIRTFDPNINNELLKKVTSFRKKDLRIIKLSNANDITRPTLKKDGRVVSRGLSMSLMKAVPVCKKILLSRKVIKALKIISSLGGVALTLLLVFGKLDFLLSSHIVAYHLIFTLIMMLVSLVTMPKLK